MSLPKTLLTLALVLPVLLVGCQEDGGGGGRVDRGADLARQITSKYDRVGGSGSIDQALTIRNSSAVPVVLEATIEPLDASGGVLPGVEARSVYGANRSGQVLVPGANVDFLIFTGAGASRVRDVRLGEVRVHAAEFPMVSELVEAVPLDRAGKEMEYPAGFSMVALRNPNPDAVTARVVSIVWNRPAEGHSQQALRVVPLSRLVTVPANGQTRIDVSPKNRQTIARYAFSNALSLKAYFSE